MTYTTIDTDIHQPPPDDAGAPADVDAPAAQDGNPLAEVPGATGMPPVQLLPSANGPFDPAPADAAGLRIRGAVGLTLLWIWVAAGMGVSLTFLQSAGWATLPAVLGLLLIHGAASGTTLWVGLRLTGLRPASVLPCHRFPTRLLPGVLLGAMGAVTVLVRVLPTLVRPDPRLVEWFQSLARNPFSFFVVVALLAPVLEELVFRGLLLRALLKRSGPVLAVLVSTALFALVHGNAAQGISAVCLGLGAAWLVLRTGSLLPGMLLHATWNATAAFGLSSLLPRAAVNLPDPHLPAWLVAAGASALVTGAALLAWQLRGSAAAGAPPEALPREARRPAGPALLAAVVLPLALLLLAAAVTSGARTRRPSPAAVAGCYELRAGSTPLALFGDSARGVTIVQLTAKPLAARGQTPPRYRLQSAAAPAAAGARDTAYWIPALHDSLRLVDTRRDLSGTILRLRHRNGELDGTVTRYAAGGQAAGAAVPVHGRKLTCPRPLATPAGPGSPASPGTRPAPTSPGAPVTPSGRR